jgi:sigma-B regulation protein RsbU (phosphoserine phosphatase)
LLRLWLINRLVKPRPYASQSTLLFVIDFILITMAGIGVAFFNTYVLGFAWVSGLEVAFGFATAGLLPALDLSLEWEYRIIRSIKQEIPVQQNRLKMSPQTRRFTLVSCTIIVFVSLVLLAIIWRDIDWISDQNQMTTSLNELLQTIAFEVLFVMAILLVFTLLVILSYSRNLKLLFGHQTRVLDLVSRGILSEKVPVVTNDEFALIAGHTNAMIDRLVERERMSRGLELAKQIQAKLLPPAAPLLPGIEVIGKCLFSDEAGGDFYDFVVRDCGQGEEIVLIVADATGHGVGSALLMASARAYLHAHLQDNLDLIEVMQRTNKLVCRDVTDSGYVVTVFLFSYTPATRTGQWVSGGHDPALFLTFGRQGVDELIGQDIPLGVDPGWQYSLTSKNMEPGLLCIGTDGIWEATNGAQEMFGKDRLHKLLLQTAQKSPATIIDAIFDQVISFTGSGRIEDDRTLVIGRIT